MLPLLLLKLETDGYPIGAIEGQVAVAQIALPESYFPEPRVLPSPASLLHHPVPRAPSAILPDAIFPRRIISYSIANYIECYQAADFSPRFDLSGMSRQGLANKFQDDRTICSFVLIEFSLPSFFFYSPMSLFARIYEATLYFSLFSMK